MNSKTIAESTQAHAKQRTTGQKIDDYLHGERNVWGSGLGLVALGLHFAGVVVDWWLYAVIAAYLIGSLSAGFLRREPVVPVEQKNEYEGDLEALITSAQGRLPEREIMRLRAINRTISEMDSNMADTTILDHEVHITQQIARSYLPRLLRTYLRLPDQYARSHKLKTGKTPVEVLQDQLSILETELEQIEIKLHENDVRALVAHGRFLEEKFGQCGFDWLGKKA